MCLATDLLVRIMMTLINNLLVLLQVFRLLVNIYETLPSPDYLNICQCLIFLDEPKCVANILEKLLRSENKEDILRAFQIAFDLVENEHQAFLLNVKDRLPVSESQSSKSSQPNSSNPDSAQNENVVAPEDVHITKRAPVSTVVHETDPKKAMYIENLTKIRGILSGETSIKLTLQFLYSHKK